MFHAVRALYEALGAKRPALCVCGHPREAHRHLPLKPPAQRTPQDEADKHKRPCRICRGVGCQDYFPHTKPVDSPFSTYS